jgi:aryl-alcohol dehydrogenase-like predicted oxidoreductase
LGVPKVGSTIDITRTARKANNLASLQWIARTNGYHEFVSMQNYHNLLYREEEREMIPFCHASGVGVIPWSPIARGVLCRPWDSRTTKREETDNFLKSLIRKRETHVDKTIVDRVEEVAKKNGVSMTCIATAWSIYKGCCPIIGLGSLERVEEAVFNANFKLSDEDAKHLEEPYQPKPIQGY